MEDNRTLKDEIIDFVRNSPEEVISILDAFIAGMQAQKNLTDCRQGTDGAPIRIGGGLSVVKTDAERE
jgi:hypothetical protein